MPYIIAIANQKGGVGKTTTAVNLSACLAKSGRRVLSVDVDSQANCTSHFGIDPEVQRRNAYHVFIEPDADFRSVILNVRPNLDLVPASLDLAMLDLQLAGAANRDRRLHKHLRGIQSRYDYVLIDCPPSLGVATINAFAACTHLIVCIQTHMFSYSGMTRLLDTVVAVMDAYETNIESYALPTLHERNSNSHQVILGRIRDHFGSNWFSPIHKNVRCVDASMKGVPVIELDRSCCASVDYFRLSREVIHEFETESRIAGSTRQLSL